jgi:hypothetical protein
MPIVSIVIGILMAITAVTFWGISESRSFTALIPSIIGAVFVIFGLVGMSPKLLKHAMHGAAAWAVVSFLASASGVLKGIQYLQGSDTATRPLAYAAQSIVCLLSVIFIILAVRSFIAARKARQAGLSVA